MILVTGAGGKTGQAVVRALAQRGTRVRALVFREEQIDPLEQLGARRVEVGDLRSGEAWNRAIRGVTAVYQICPNVHPQEVEIGGQAIAACRRAGVGRFVYHSVLHPYTEAMPHHWRKLKVEEMLLESGLEHTVLQPAPYMQNVLAHWRQITTDGSLPIPYSAETRLALVDLDDVAEVAATVLTEEGHVGAVYPLCGEGRLSQEEVTAILGTALGRRIVVQRVPLAQWVREAKSAGMEEARVESLVAMFRYYDAYGLGGNSNVLQWLLGREPTSLLTFAERQLKR